jgi:hypothetical protein
VLPSSKREKALKLAGATGLLRDFVSFNLGGHDKINALKNLTVDELN